MASAYYSRNNSYSRSYNASVAETEERFPLTRAAAHLGLSVASFKKGLEFAGISTSEWHHVGKYANRVDYYDVSDESEIVNSLSFWNGAKNKSNKTICENYRKDVLKRKANERLEEKLAFVKPSQKKYVVNTYAGGELIISLKENATDRDLSHSIRTVGMKRLTERRKPNEKYHPTRVIIFPNGNIKEEGYSTFYLYSQIEWELYEFHHANNGMLHFYKK